MRSSSPPRIFSTRPLFYSLEPAPAAAAAGGDPAGPPTPPRRAPSFIAAASAAAAASSELSPQFRLPFWSNTEMPVGGWDWVAGRRPDSEFPCSRAGGASPPEKQKKKKNLHFLRLPPLGRGLQITHAALSSRFSSWPGWLEFLHRRRACGSLHFLLLGRPRRWVRLKGREGGPGYVQRVCVAQAMHSLQYIHVFVCF